MDLSYNLPTNMVPQTKIESQDKEHHHHQNDGESTSASTVSTLGRQQPYRSPVPASADKAARRISPPISSVRRISWDNCKLDLDRDRRSRSLSKRRKLNGITLNNGSCSIKSIHTNTNSGSIDGDSGNPQESLNGRHNEEDKKSSKAVIIGREVFVVFILITAGVFGSMSY